MDEWKHSIKIREALPFYGSEVRMYNINIKIIAKLLIIPLMVFSTLTYHSVAAVIESNLDEKELKGKLSASNAKTCITSECHQELMKEKYVHPNITEKKCLICHDPTKKCTKYESGKKHTFTLKGQDAELCFPCHKIGEKEYVHETIKKGICLECHNAHQSQYPNLLKSSPIATICLKCHVKGIFKGKTIHGPVALGHCNICHEPHESYYEALTRGKPTEECYKCHEKERTEFAKEVGAGNFESDYVPLSKDDSLGHALLRMRKDLHESEKELERKVDERTEEVVRQKEEIELQIDSLGYSSLVVRLGGVGFTYPTMVIESSNIRRTIDRIVEE